MAVACEVDDKNKEIIYTFRFNTTDKIIHITEQQLNCIPYLSALTTHDNNLLSIKNENDEYVLDSRIRYNWFMPILQSIITQHPSALLTELPREVYLWGMLQLYDYLCLNPISVPLLKGQHLIQLNSSNIDSESLCIEYKWAKNLLEVRDTAVQFIIALTKNEYNLDDSKTLHSIFSLIMVVLSSPNMFGLRLCHHTLTVAKKMYFSLFSDQQQRELKNARQSIRSIKARSFRHLYDDHQELPESFGNAFAWRGTYVVIKINDGANSQPSYNKTSTRDRILFELSHWIDKVYFDRYFEPDFISSRIIFNELIGDIDWHSQDWIVKHDETLRKDAARREEHHLWLTLRSSISESNLYNLLPVLREQASLMIDNPDDKELYIHPIKQQQKKTEARSARSGCFNTLPKRPTIDRFKHRCGPKPQKYR